VTTGTPTGAAGTSQASIEGQLKIDPAALEDAIHSDPAGVEKMLQGWSQGFQALLDGEAQAGGVLEARIQGASSEISALGRRMSTMNELLVERQKALQATYARLEGVISQNQSQATWLAGQTLSLNSSGL
jgi:flagellar capping protein FliD